MHRSRSWPCRPWSSIAALAFAAVLLAGAAAGAADDSASLAGQLLVAAPTMGDPRFAHAVILVVRQDRSGAFGIVINHPIEERSVASLLAATGDDAKGAEGKLEVYEGGPVQPELGFVVHSPDYRDKATMSVGEKLALTADKEILRAIGHHKGPKKVLVMFGYAGWSPGQLEGEIADHDWFTTTADPKLIFDHDPGNLWDEAMARRTREL
jgi:putative transcriptional regulator